MKLSNIHIIGVLLTIFFVKQLNLDINLLVNIVIFLVVVYYYYNENEVDNKNKDNLTDFLNNKSKENGTPLTEIEIKKTEPIIEHLESLRLFSEKHDHINQDVVKQLIVNTNTLFKEKSVFYREYINQLLDEIELLNDINMDYKLEYLEIKNKIINELDNIVEIKDPISFYQFKGTYKMY